MTCNFSIYAFRLQNKVDSDNVQILLLFSQSVKTVRTLREANRDINKKKVNKTNKTNQQTNKRQNRPQFSFLLYDCKSSAHKSQILCVLQKRRYFRVTFFRLNFYAHTKTERQKEKKSKENQQQHRIIAFL